MVISSNPWTWRASVLGQEGVFALCLINGLLATECRANPDKGGANFFQSRSPWFQGRRAVTSERRPGERSRDNEISLSHSEVTVSYPRSVSSTYNDPVSKHRRQQKLKAQQLHRQNHRLLTHVSHVCTTNMVVGSTIIGILSNVWFNTLHLSVVVSYGSVIIVGHHNLSKSRIIEGLFYDCQTRK